jgi:hypothetical protein
MISSNKLNHSSGISGNPASTMEDTIQQATNSKMSEAEKVDLETRTKVEECSDTSDGRLGENEGKEEGMVTAAKTEPEYPTGIRFVLVTISLMLGVYMVALDTQIICKPITLQTLERRG